MWVYECVCGNTSCGQLTYCVCDYKELVIFIVASDLPDTFLRMNHVDSLLCLQLHTEVYPYTVHASIPCWCLTVSTAAHRSVSIHSTCFYPMLMPYCVYSCTQTCLHTQYMLLIYTDALLCLQLHTVMCPYTVDASNPCWCLAVPTAAHRSVSIHST